MGQFSDEKKKEKMKKEEKEETKGRDHQFSPCLRPAMLHMKVCWKSKGGGSGVQGLRGFRGLCVQGGRVDTSFQATKGVASGTE